MKTLLILPYFGTLPNYFDLYLHTVKANPSIDWLLFTDDTTPRDFPANMKVINISWEDMKARMQTRFDIRLNLERKHKLCDFKPAYGYIFENLLDGYDFWGHCDPDIIWGNFERFIDYNKFDGIDKIFILGHLTLFRNTPENNRRFMEDVDNQLRYRQVLTNRLGFAFDEKFGGSINNIFMEHGWPMFTESFAADIDPYHTNFRLSILDFDTQRYRLDGVKRQIFTWEDGHVYRYYIKQKQLVKEEFLYIHLQKRKMELNIAAPFPRRFLIQPKSFEALDETITLENFKRHYKHFWFNNQFFKVKYNSLKFRLKYKVYG